MKGQNILMRVKLNREYECVADELEDVINKLIKRNHTNSAIKVVKFMNILNNEVDKVLPLELASQDLNYFLTARETYRRMLYNHLKYYVKDITNSEEINKVAYEFYKKVKNYPFLRF